MIHLIVASHGPLSASIVKSASLIAGSSSIADIKTISITMETSVEEVRQAVETILESFDENDKILAYGGSITRVISEYIGVRKLDVITGVNLGILLEAIFMKDTMEYDELVSYLIVNGKNGIRHINTELESKGGEEI